MKRESYEYTPLEIYHAVRANRPDISFDGFNNKVFLDDEERIMTVRVTSRYEVNEYDDENREPIVPVDERDIINAEGDFVYRDAFILSSRSSRAPSWKMYAFTGLDVSFTIGEGILDFCYTDFTKEQDGILLLGALFSSAKKREAIVRNQDEVLEAESSNMERTLSSLDKYLYQSVYSSIFPPYIEHFTKDSIPIYIYYISEIQKEMLRRIEFVFDYEFYPDELSKLLPCERYAIYSEAYGTPKDFIREERFTMNGNLNPRYLKRGNIALFRKYYKRYYARTKVNQIKPDKFREWNYKAVEMRDRCQSGEITPEEFEEWLYESFRNRRKKE